MFYDCRTRDQKQIEIYDSNFCRLFPDAEKIHHLYSGHFMVWEGGNCTITDGSVSAELGPLSPVLNYYTDYQGSRDLILISCFFQNGQDYWLLDDQLRLIAEGMLENRGLEMKQDQIGNSSIVTWYPWGVNYPYSCEIFDYPGAPKLENVKVLGAYDGWYMVEDDFSSGYMDADGNWLFRVNLMADMTD